MKIILFDLGKTLEDNDVLLPGARETLEAISRMRDAAGDPAVLSVISDFDMPATPGQIEAIRAQYFAILENLGIRTFFEPVAQRVTLSTEVGVFKPKRQIFRAAVDKIDPGLRFQDVIFITENGGHVAAARRLGMEAVHFQGPGETTGDILRLVDLIPLVEDWLAAPAQPRAGAPAPPAAGAVKVATGTLPTGTAASRADGSAPLDAAWARFGDEMLFFAPEERWPAVSARAASRGMQIQELGERVDRERLHLVVQKGGLFQRAHPEVPVILDRGRFLVVELDPEAAARLDRGDEPCYTLRSLEENEVVFETRAPAARAAPLPWIQDLVDRLDRAAYQQDLTALASLRTRLSTGPEFLQAAGAARDRLNGMGYATEVKMITVGAGTSLNVIADRPGSGPDPRGVVLVTAHLDSINEDGAAAPAPGADDNASGAAGVLQIARVFQTHRAIHDLRFILFGGEEQGLHGSIQYVAGLPTEERRRIRAVVNMDMIATLNEPTPAVLLEGKAVSQAVIDALAEAGATYTGLQIRTSLAAADSDHVSFLRAMVPAVLTIEGADRTNHNIHSANDTLDHVNAGLALEILRMNTAFVAATIGLAP